MKNSEDKPKAASKTYLWLVVVSLFLMPLTSAIDGSFFSIFLGLTTIFFYLGVKDSSFWTRSEPRAQQRSYESRPHGGRETGNTQDKSSKPPLTEEEKKKRRLGCIIGAVVVIIFISVVVEIFSTLGDSFDADEAYYTSVGYDEFNASQFDSAAVNFRRAIRINPEYIEALQGYGRTFLSQTKNDSALVMFDKVIAIDPQYSEGHYYKGWVYYYKENYDQAIAQVNESLKINPDYYAAMALAGHAYYAKKDYDNSLKYYEQAYAAEYRESFMLWVMAYIYQQKSNKEKAIALYRETLSYDSSIVEVYDALGELLPGADGNFFRIKGAEIRAYSNQ